LEVGRGITRVGGHALERRTGGIGSTLQLIEGEAEVGELRLSVSTPARVTALAVNVAEVDAPDAVGLARDSDHARLAAGEQPFEEEAGKREVAEVVCADLHLKAVGGKAAGQGHDAGVVYKQVESLVAVGKAVRAKSRTECRSARSRRSISTEASGADSRIDAAACSPRATSRAGRNYRAPACASSREVKKASPLLAPVTVTTARRPVWCGMSAYVHFARHSPENA